MIDKKKLKHYCPVPFYSIEINTNETAKLCCVSSKRYKTNKNFIEFWNSEEMESVRERMLSDEPDHQDCGVCYSREDNFNFSKRYDDLYRYKRFFTKKLIFPAHLQLKITNICNLKCIMCSPQYSSKWNEDVDKLKHMRTSLVKTKPEYLEHDYLKKILSMYLQTKTLTPKKIELYGGEPMLAKHFWKIIYNIDPIKLKNVSFVTNTNGTIITDEHIKCLFRFKKCMINFSIDGIEDVFEFVRFPANWNRVESNIKKLITYQDKLPHKFEIGLYYTLSSYSAIGLNDFIDYCHKNGYKYYINIADTEPTPTEFYESRMNELKEKYTEEEINMLGLAVDPSINVVNFSHPSALPDRIKNKIINQVENKIDADDFYKIKNALNVGHVELNKIQKRFLVYCDLIKSVRGKDFKELMEKYESS